MDQSVFIETWTRFTSGSLNDAQMRKKAFEELYVALNEKLLVRAKNLLNNYSEFALDEYDLVSIAFVRLFELIEKKYDSVTVESIKHLENYLFTIQKNYLYKYHRDRGNEILFDYEENDHLQPIDESESIERIIQSSESIKAFNFEDSFSKFRTANPFCFKLLDLKMLKGLHYNEIVEHNEFASFKNSIRERKKYCQDSLKKFLLKENFRYNEFLV